MLFPGFRRILQVLPAIIISTFLNVIISFATAGLIMLQLMPVMGREHPHLVLFITGLVAVGTHAWILFNHKIREYIKIMGDLK